MSGYSYLLTRVDRFTGWPEAVPIQGTTDETVTYAFVEQRERNLYCPSTNTEDHEHQFESGPFRCRVLILGVTRSRTTAYHPEANGFVKWFHQRLNASRSAKNASQWTGALPFVLLGIFNAVKSNVGYTLAELLYGRTLQLSGEFVHPPSSSLNVNLTSYTDRLTHLMRPFKHVST